jgi:signal transduction histidine kinase
MILVYIKSFAPATHIANRAVVERRYHRGGCISALVPMKADPNLAQAHALIQHLQLRGESDKALTARKLHDDIAELMIAALMDLSAAVQYLPSAEGRAHQRISRAKNVLHTAIDRSRELVEELRPTLLANAGLFSALKWQVQKAKEGKNLIYTEWYPETEPDLPADASIALFRIAQEALAMTLRRGSLDVADLEVRVDKNGLSVKFTDNGVPIMVDGLEEGSGISLAAMRWRLFTLGGTVDIERSDAGTVLTARIPLARS